jgi:hypothetical protein
MNHATTGRPGKDEARPDLHTQLEEFLHQVWLCEADWRFNDRIDLATRHTIAKKRRPRRPHV